MTVTVLFKKLVEHAIVPKKATLGAACFDLYAAESVSIQSKNYEKVKTGLSVQIQEGFCMLIFSRSGHGFNSGVTLVNSTGIIDSDYRGEIIVGLKNDHSWQEFEIEKGDRIAQAMIVPVYDVNFLEVPELGDTQRGQGGFGSTGKN